MEWMENCVLKTVLSLSQSPEGSIYMEFLNGNSFITVNGRLSRPKAQSTWNFKKCGRNRNGSSLSRPKAQSTWNMLRLHSRPLMPKVSVARRLNLHGILLMVQVKRIDYLSQSPEGSIYMEYWSGRIFYNRKVVSLSRPKAQSTWNCFKAHTGGNTTKVSVARRLNLHGICPMLKRWDGVPLSQSPEGSIYME